MDDFDRMIDLLARIDDRLKYLTEQLSTIGEILIETKKHVEHERIVQGVDSNKLTEITKSLSNIAKYLEAEGKSPI